MTFAQFVILAVLAETLTETVKWVIGPQDKAELRNRLIALGFALVVCVGTSFDIFKLVQIPLVVPYLGSVLSGILASRGANAVHDLIKLLTPASSG